MFSHSQVDLGSKCVSERFVSAVGLRRAGAEGQISWHKDVFPVHTPASVEKVPRHQTGVLGKSHLRYPIPPMRQPDSHLSSIL